MAYFPMDGHGWPILQYPSLSSNPLSSTDPTSSTFASRNFLSNNFGLDANTFNFPGQVIELSGYLFSHGKTRDNSKGNYVEYALQSKNINIQSPPPFIPVTGKTAHSNHGVIKLSNIPFTVTEQEIRQFLNRNIPSIQILEKHTQGLPIHIIMEKSTGKTMDCFVELSSPSAAFQCASRFAQNSRGVRLGSRNVTVDTSSQAELMKAVFPRARYVDFDDSTGHPTIRSHDQNDNDWTEGFRGYFTIEEIHGVVRFAESPSRSPFVLKAHQRVYECMISTLYKFPWAATDTYTVSARNALFVAVYTQIEILAGKVGSFGSQDGDSGHYAFSPYAGNMYNGAGSACSSDRSTSGYGNREVGLNQTLLFDLLIAAVNVPVFSILQKTALCKAAGAAGRGVTLGYFSEAWPFQTLEPADGVSNEAIRFWLELFDTGFEIMDREGTQTGFEGYLIFSRTKFGFPIAEWTSNGVNLHFDKAVEVEMAVVDKYVNCGREYWSREKQVYFDPTATSTLMDVFTTSSHVGSTRRLMYAANATTSRLRSAAVLTEADMSGRLGTNSYHTTDDDDISPTSSRDLRSSQLSQGTRSVLHGSEGPSLPSTPNSDVRHRFNAATAVAFVPSSRREQTSDTCPAYVPPMKLSIATNTYVQPGPTTSLPLSHTAHIAMRESRRNHQTPSRPQVLSIASAIEPSSLSNPSSTPFLHDLGDEVLDTGHQACAVTHPPGLPNHVLRDFNNFTFDPASSSTQTNPLVAARSQIQPIVTVHNRLSESPGSLAPDDIFPNDVHRSNLMRSLEQESKSLADLGSLDSQPQASIRPDFGPIGTTRASISEGSQNPASPAAAALPDMPAYPNRAHSISFAARARSSSNRAVRGNGGRLSAAELFSSVYPNFAKE